MLLRRTVFCLALGFAAACDSVPSESQGVQTSPPGTATTSTPGSSSPKLSGQLVYSAGSPVESELYVLQVGVDGAVPTKLPQPSGVYDGWPAWTPDGKQIVFSRSNPNNRQNTIEMMAPDGSNARQLAQCVNECQFITPTADGRVYYVDSFTSGRNASAPVYSVPVSGGSPVEWAPLQGTTTRPRLRRSTDGRMLVVETPGIGSTYIVGIDQMVLPPALDPSISGVADVLALLGPQSNKLHLFVTDSMFAMQVYETDLSGKSPSMTLKVEPALALDRGATMFSPDGKFVLTAVNGLRAIHLQGASGSFVPIVGVPDNAQVRHFDFR